MRRFALASVLIVVTSLATLSAQQPSAVVGLGFLNLGPIYAVKAVELDGHPGSEFLVQTGGPFAPNWRVVYPGVCIAPDSVTIESDDQFVDRDGDGKQEIMRFDVQAQTVAFIPFPDCAAQ